MRLCKNLNFDVKAVQPNIGLEQEFFFVPRDAYYRRPDLQLTGRSVMGKEAPRGQEMSDHYMSPPNQLARDCMREIQHECFLMGIPLRTRHREVCVCMCLLASSTFAPGSPFYLFDQAPCPISHPISFHIFASVPCQ